MTGEFNLSERMILESQKEVFGNIFQEVDVKEFIRLLKESFVQTFGDFDSDNYLTIEQRNIVIKNIDKLAGKKLIEESAVV